MDFIVVSQADAMILAATRRSAANFPQVGHTCEYLDALFSKQNNTEVGHTCEYLDALFSKHRPTSTCDFCTFLTIATCTYFKLRLEIIPYLFHKLYALFWPSDGVFDPPRERERVSESLVQSATCAYSALRLFRSMRISSALALANCVVDRISPE